jgi:hypothetical protein
MATNAGVRRTATTFLSSAAKQDGGGTMDERYLFTVLNCRNGNMKIGSFSLKKGLCMGVVFEDRVVDLSQLAWRGESPSINRLTHLFLTESFSVDLIVALFGAAKRRKTVA